MIGVRDEDHIGRRELLETSQVSGIRESGSAQDLLVALTGVVDELGVAFGGGEELLDGGSLSGSAR